LQTCLFPDLNTQRAHQPVNVASVPQRSPFRYPGGKTWFVPQFRHWMALHRHKPKILLEPFAGGGSIGLCAAFENIVEQVVMVELDPDVAAVWHTVTGKDNNWLVQRVLDFDLTTENVSTVLSQQAFSTKERAFQTILKNRTFHGGILAAGSGLLKHGENGKGIKSRWYPETLAKRMLQIAHHIHKISFIEGNGIEFIQKYQTNQDCSMFIDPPYTAGGKKAGKRLYTHHSLDHNELFDLCANLEGLFLMTYDNAAEIQKMADLRGFRSQEISMKNTHHACMTELIIGKSSDPLFLAH
jgi:DNA adenine methylase